MATWRPGSYRLSIFRQKCQITVTEQKCCVSCFWRSSPSKVSTSRVPGVCLLCIVLLCLPLHTFVVLFPPNHQPQHGQDKWTSRPSSTLETPPRRPRPMAGAEASTPVDRLLLLLMLRGDGPRLVLVPLPLLLEVVLLLLGRWTPTSSDCCGSTRTVTTMTTAMILMQMSKTTSAAGTNHGTAREVPLRRPAVQSSVPTMCAAAAAATSRRNAKLPWPGAAAGRYFPCRPPVLVDHRRPGPSRFAAAPPAAAAARPPFRPTRP